MSASDMLRTSTSLNGTSGYAAVYCDHCHRKGPERHFNSRKGVYQGYAEARAQESALLQGWYIVRGAVALCLDCKRKEGIG